MKLTNPFKIINRYMEAAPVDVVGLAGEFGITVSYTQLGDTMAGMIKKTGDTYCITVNATDGIIRQRFTIAHELGHYIFHRTSIADGIGDDKQYRSAPIGNYINTAIGKEAESEANQFAVTLLMPLDLISEMQRSGITSTQEIASRLLVSHQALCMRLGVSLDNNPSSLNMSRPTQVTAQ